MPRIASEKATKKLQDILTLPENKFNQFIKASKSSPIVSSADALISNLSKEIKIFPAEELEEVIKTVDSLYHVREFSGVRHDRFFNDLLEDLCDGINEANCTTIKANLQALLDIPVFKAIAKADRLQNDGDRIYCESKIISDIRPVFDADPKAKPIGAVVTHTLKIAFHGDDHNEFRVVLDSEELTSLKENIERALQKDEALRKMISEVDLKILGI